MNLKKIIEKLIFGSKWLLIPFYFYLFWTLIQLMFEFLTQGHISDEVLIQTLEAVDITMVGNLVKMIITGSYNSFVSKNHDEQTEKVSSGLLKVKMSTSIMGVSSIHLLQTFIAAKNTDWDTIWKQLAVHGIFIIGALVLAQIDFLHNKSESINKDH
jgi:uncharacterized protein (TIGR00645 family)